MVQPPHYWADENLPKGAAATPFIAAIFSIVGLYVHSETGSNRLGGVAQW